MIFGSGNGSPGTTNLGGGGGGADYGAVDGGNGGSGIVVLKYPAARTLNAGPGLTVSTVTSGDYKISTFTAGTGTISFS